MGWFKKKKSPPSPSTTDRGKMVDVDVLQCVLAFTLGAVAIYFFMGKAGDTASTTSVQEQEQEPVLDPKAEKARAKAKAAADRREKEKMAAIARKKEQAAAEQAADKAAAEKRATDQAKQADSNPSADASGGGAVDTSPDSIVAQLDEAGFACVSVSDLLGKEVTKNAGLDAAMKTAIGIDLIHDIISLVRSARSKQPSISFGGAAYGLSVRDKSVPGTILVQGKDPKGSTRLVALVAPKRVVIASYEFENATREAEQMATAHGIWKAFGKK
jgi:hypothetical protein